MAGSVYLQWRCFFLKSETCMSGTWPSFRGRRFFLLPDPQKLGHLPGLWWKTCSAHQPGLKLCSAWQMGQMRVKFPAETPLMWIISRILLQPGFLWTSKRGPWKQLAIHSKIPVWNFWEIPKCQEMPPVTCKNNVLNKLLAVFLASHIAVPSITCALSKLKHP